MGKFVVNQEVLSEAVNNYNNAMTTFDSARTAYNEAKEMMDWTDSAAEAWAEVADNYSKELDRAYSKLESNKNLIDKMQEAARTDQTQTITGINNVFN